MLLARAGVPGSFAALIRRHEARALRVACRFVGDPALAADITQNACVALFRALGQYRANGKFKPYFYRILINQCRMARRSARGEHRLVETLRADVNPDTAQVLLRERRRDVEAAVGHLSKKLREVVLLRYGADLDYREIAETLGIPVGTVKRRMFVAMAKLRESLEAP
jgi:RNA polymerase sigma-70 factor (ECF subfamily)